MYRLSLSAQRAPVRSVAMLAQVLGEPTISLGVMLSMAAFTVKTITLVSLFMQRAAACTVCSASCCSMCAPQSNSCPHGCVAKADTVPPSCANDGSSGTSTTTSYADVDCNSLSTADCIVGPAMTRCHVDHCLQKCQQGPGLGTPGQPTECSTTSTTTSTSTKRTSTSMPTKLNTFDAEGPFAASCTDRILQIRWMSMIVAVRVFQ